jgi:nitrite reductase/ring-hydroxylating ferredoxin subunit
LELKFLKRNILQRLFGISATQPPSQPNCWRHSENKIIIDLEHAPELAQPGGALRLEGKNLSQRVLVIHGEDGKFHAFQNSCQHMGRRLDPVPGTDTVQCCSVGKSTYDLNGNVVYGPAKGPVKVLSAKRSGESLEIAW